MKKQPLCTIFSFFLLHSSVAFANGKPQRSNGNRTHLRLVKDNPKPSANTYRPQPNVDANGLQRRSATHYYILDKDLPREVTSRASTGKTRENSSTRFRSTIGDYRTISSAAQRYLIPTPVFDRYGKRLSPEQIKHRAKMRKLLTLHTNHSFEYADKFKAGIDKAFSAPPKNNQQYRSDLRTSHDFGITRGQWGKLDLPKTSHYLDRLTSAIRNELGQSTQMIRISKYAPNNQHHIGETVLDVAIGDIRTWEKSDKESAISPIVIHTRQGPYPPFPATYLVHQLVDGKIKNPGSELHIGNLPEAIPPEANSRNK